MILRSVGSAVVRSFIVRIYRATPNKPDRLFGEAEEAGKKRGK